MASIVPPSLQLESMVGVLSRIFGFIGVWCEGSSVGNADCCDC